MPGKFVDGPSFDVTGVSSTAASIKGIYTGTVTVDLADQGAASVGQNDITITGVAVGDFVLLTPPADLSVAVSFSPAYVSAADTVTVLVNNPTAGSLNAASASWTYVWFDLT